MARMQSDGALPGTNRRGARLDSDSVVSWCELGVYVPQETSDLLVSAARMRALGHDVPLLYIAISPTPSRERHLDLVLEVNRQIAACCADDPQLHFVDTASALLDENGRPDPRWFVADRLHLNPDGYASWTSTVRPALERVLGD